MTISDQSDTTCGKTLPQSGIALWRSTREDIAPLALILLLPFTLALPQILGLFKSDPALYIGWMSEGTVRGIVGGLPYIDPNSGFTTQALGYRAALDWIQGNVPWWNPYTGVGIPLAAEYQPAAFFPLTFLLLLPNGMMWEHLLLQILAGVGTYALLRQMGIGRLAGTTAGLLYAFNGTLAWFAHAPALVVPFLPWMLLGVERARVKAAIKVGGGWRTLSLAMALSLLAGFPETAYINGLLALAWVILRGIQMPLDCRARYAMSIILGGGVGIAIAAPQILAFLEYLPHANIGGHATDFAHAAYSPEGIVPTLIAPYVYGPIFAYADRWTPHLGNLWGGLGGYVSVTILVLAAYGLIARRSALNWLLFAWCVATLTKSFDIEPATTLMNTIPGVAIAAFARYVQPSWEFALIVLAAWGLDDVAKSPVRRRGALLASGLVLLVAIGGTAFFGVRLWPIFAKAGVALRNWASFSALWATLTALLCFTFIYRARLRRGRALAVLLIFDSAFMYAIPTFSAPRGGSVDMAAIGFLRENLGLQRFYTLGPIQANYGAYFGIASINHNYLPVSRRWTAWITQHLDRAADPIIFNGTGRSSADQPTQTQELRRNLPAYEWVGVKYVVSPAGHNPFTDNEGSAATEDEVKQVYADGLLSIFELPHPRPYFEVLGGDCKIESLGRMRLIADCASTATLMRRELFFPGWTATVNGKDVAIGEREELFQTIELSAGRSEIRFDYAPPYVGWAWLATFVGLGLFVGTGFASKTPKREAA